MNKPAQVPPPERCESADQSSTDGRVSVRFRERVHFPETES